MRDFEAICESMKAHGMKLPSDREILRLSDAKQAMRASLRYFLEQKGTRAVWLPQYDEVSGWLQDN